MRNSVQALLWEVWRPNRIRCITTMVSMLCVPGIMTLVSLPRHPLEMRYGDFLPMSWESQMITLWVNLIICVLSVGYGMGYPTRHYALPVTTRQLVLIRLIPGALSCSLLSLAVSGLFNQLFNAGFPYLGPTLTYGIGYLAGYALVSIFYARENMRTLAGLGAGLIVGFWIFGHYPTWWNFGLQFRWPVVGPLELGVLVATVVLSWALLESVLTLDRKGWGWAQPSHRSESQEAERYIHHSPARRFRSAFGALYWQEWRQDGWLWPLGLASTFAMVVTIHFSTFLYGGHVGFPEDTASEIVTITFAFLVMGALLPWCLGAVTRQGRKSQADKPLPTSISTLPISDKTLAWVTILRSMASVGMSWLCVGLIAVVWATCRSLVADGVNWATLFSSRGNPNYWMAVFGIASYLILTAWLTIGVGAATGLSGRSWIVFLPILFILFWIGAGVLSIIVDHSTAEALLTLVATVIPVWLAVGTIAAYVRGGSRGVIGIETLLLGVAILLFVESLFVAELLYTSVSHPMTGVRWGTIWRFGLFLTVAAAPPAVVPLSVHYNRHR